MRSIKMLMPCLALPLAVPLHAGEPDKPLTARQIAAQTRDFFGFKDPDRNCSETQPDGVIVVCARPKAPPSRYEEVKPYARPDSKMIALGAPPVGHGVGAGVTIRGCFLQKCPKDLYFFDIAALPEPAQGTDADKIAKGL
jgi:hypothetical protein